MPPDERKLPIPMCRSNGTSGWRASRPLHVAPLAGTVDDVQILGHDGAFAPSVAECLIGRAPNLFLPLGSGLQDVHRLEQLLGRLEQLSTAGLLHDFGKWTEAPRNHRCRVAECLDQGNPEGFETDR